MYVNELTINVSEGLTPSTGTESLVLIIFVLTKFRLLNDYFLEFRVLSPSSVILMSAFDIFLSSRSCQDDVPHKNILGVASLCQHIEVLIPLFTI